MAKEDTYSRCRANNALPLAHDGNTMLRTTVVQAASVVLGKPAMLVAFGARNWPLAGS